MSSEKGSFRISRQALDALIHLKATAWQIGTYLTLARYTDESGKFSTAGRKAIYNATGASPGTEKEPGAAARLIRELTTMQINTPNKKSKPEKLIYIPEEWRALKSQDVLIIPHKNHAVRWVLNDFGGQEWVWFPNSLVDGVGRFRQPLKRLKQSGDVAARLLLLLYANNDRNGICGIHPFKNAYVHYSLQHCITSHSFTFWKATREHQTVFTELSLPTLGLAKLPTDEDKKIEALRPFWNALSSLENGGFMYEVVTVMDGTANSDDCCPLYELDIKTRFSFLSLEESPLASRINNIFLQVTSESVADGMGRFYDNYPVICRVGIQPHVVGLYRIRFRISNQKNSPVVMVWQGRKRDQENITDDLEWLENQLNKGGNSP